MKYKVSLVTDAEEDIFEIYRYMAVTESVDKAESIFNALQKACTGLSKFPNRGHYPPELERIGVCEYREIHCPPFRIIYQVIQSDVHIHCVLDGRREITELLEKRLLRM